VLSEANAMKEASLALAKIDVTSSLALLATDFNYVRPIIDNSFSFNVTAGKIILIS